MKFPDHNVSDLVSQAGILKPLFADGHYSQVSARYSMAQHPGWQLNKRVYNVNEGIWLNWDEAPSVNQSSQLFFKRQIQPELESRPFIGLSAGTEYAQIGPLTIESRDVAVEPRVIFEDDLTTVEKVVSPWLTLEQVDDLEFSTRAKSNYDAIGRVFIEKKSDGTRLPINVIASNQNGKRLRWKYRLIADPTEKYRVVLEPIVEERGLSFDLAIGERDEGLSKNINTDLLVLNLRSMKVVDAEYSVLDAYPNPTDGLVTFVPSVLDSESSVGRISVLSLSGRIIDSRPCRVTESFEYDASSLATGAYYVMLQDRNGRVLGRKLLVKH